MDERDRHPPSSNDPSTPPADEVRERVASARPAPLSRSRDGAPAVVPYDASPTAQPRGERQEAANGLKEEGEAKGEGVEQEQLETATDDDRIAEPFDPTKIRIVTKQPSVYLVIERIKRGEIDLEPDFQRAGYIWPHTTRSRLIESLLLRIPLPVFYMAADLDDNWQVVDGLQRLGALKSFVLHKELRLRGLEYLAQFEGKSYDDLPRPMQRRINETQLSFHIIEPGTPPEVMYNVFKRINTEGMPLKGQEVRHALNPDPARSLLRELAGSAEFLAATDHTVSPKRMADRECVLRFLAFRSLGIDGYAGKLDEFLMKAMRSLNDDRSRHLSLGDDFKRAMSLATRIFGRDAFRKPSRPGYASWRSPVNKPLFESLAVALAEIPEDRVDLLIVRGKDVVNGLNDLMEDTEFFESITVGTQTNRAVRIRFERIRKLIQGARS